MSPTKSAGFMKSEFLLLNTSFLSMALISNEVYAAVEKKIAMPAANAQESFPNRTFSTGWMVMLL